MKILSPLHNYLRTDTMSYSLRNLHGRAIPERICQMDETVIAAQALWGFTEQELSLVRFVLHHVLNMGTATMEDTYRLAEKCPGAIEHFVTSGKLQDIKAGKLAAEDFFNLWQQAVLQCIDDQTGFISTTAFIESRES